MAENTSQSQTDNTPKASDIEHRVKSLPPLMQAMQKHRLSEKISFHTPGHKGRLAELSPDFELTGAMDLTELPGLDDLSQPDGPLLALAKTASAIYQSDQTLLSVNGATLAIMAAIISVGHAQKGERAAILVPRNAHRCVIEALCLTDLTPIWYEPEFDHQFNVWGQVNTDHLISVIQEHSTTNKIAMLVVVSPTYGGAVSDISAIAELAFRHNFVLLVDEAHGAHHIDGDRHKPACQLGAHLTAHSLHKTLSGLTQTGLLHISKDCPVPASVLHETMMQLTSTSPSYLLMASIEAALALISSTKGKERINSFFELGTDLKEQIKNLPDYQLYATTSNTNSHVLIKHKNADSASLIQHLVNHGIYAEAELGAGILLLLGIGTKTSDVTSLLNCLQNFTACGNQQAKPNNKPVALIAAMTPYAASRQARTTIPAKQALNRVAAEFLAPCPPGIPLIIPGQLITREVLESTRKELISVVV